MVFEQREGGREGQEEGGADDVKNIGKYKEQWDEKENFIVTEKNKGFIFCYQVVGKEISKTSSQMTSHCFHPCFRKYILVDRQ